MALRTAPSRTASAAAPSRFPSPALYAHRGASRERPENTLPAFERALSVGADALELDVHLTADHRVLVAHDADALRAAGVPVAFHRATLAEVRTWDAGRGFLAPDGGRPYAGRGVRFPTLDEVLAEFPGALLNVDIKRHGAVMVAPLLALLRRESAEARVRLTSFDAATVRAVRRAGYEGPTGLARAEVTALALAPRAVLERFRASVLGNGDAAQVPVRAGPLELTAPWFLRRCRALGVRVDYWVVNDPVEARSLLERGADGLVSDDPAALAPVIAAFRAR